jgi:hypothetical protein
MEDFVEGMDLVHGVKYDLSSARQITLDSRENVQKLKEGLMN